MENISVVNPTNGELDLGGGTDRFDSITKTNTIKTITHRFYIDEGIYREESWVYPLKKVLAGTETDVNNTVVDIYMNTHGGDVYLALELIELINRSPLKVNVYIDSICMSAGTLILFSCDWNKVVINPYASFLFHDVRTFEYGKKSDILDSINHLNGLFDKLVSNAFKGFLTPTEIKQINSGKELYMLGEEVLRRLKQRINKASNKKRNPKKDTSKK